MDYTECCHQHVGHGYHCTKKSHHRSSSSMKVKEELENAILVMTL
jgi:hypothetical protein